MGRKRNQGKARRAAKAKANEEAANHQVESGNNQTTTLPEEQSLLVQILQLHFSEIKCKHGVERVVSTGNSVVRFVDAFKESFFEAIRRGDRPFDASIFVDAKIATMDEFADVWKDSAKLEMAMSACLCMGTQHLIEGNNHDARDLATFARFFEQHIAVYLKQTQALINWSKINDMYHVDVHTVVKFFRHRISCSCLDELYEMVKHVTKIGLCWNPSECKFPNGKTERSNTKYCSRCRCVTYCSRECQEAHWTDHKSYCDHSAALIAKFEAKRQE